MIPVPSGVRVWLAVGRTDMRKGMNGLALQVQQALGRDPHAGDLYVFRGARGDLINLMRQARSRRSFPAMCLGFSVAVSLLSHRPDFMAEGAAVIRLYNLPCRCRPAGGTAAPAPSGS